MGSRRRVNPRDAACEGHYGYGTGYFAVEAFRGEFGYMGRSFCGVCPLEYECRSQSSDDVFAEHGEEMDTFFAAINLAPQLGICPQEIEAGMNRVGNVNPLLQAYAQNLRCGVEDREND